jgi:hypothetical protein
MAAYFLTAAAAPDWGGVLEPPMQIPLPKPAPKPVRKKPAPPPADLPKPAIVPPAKTIQALSPSALLSIGEAPSAAPQFNDRKAPAGRSFEEALQRDAMFQTTQKQGPRGMLSDMGQAMREAFRADPELTKYQHKELDEVLAQWKNEFVGSSRRETSAAQPLYMWLDHSAKAREALQQSHHFRPKDEVIFGLLCAGDCGQKHETYRLTTLIRIEHGDDGHPLVAIVESPSWLLSFDKLALDTVKATAEKEWERPEGTPLPRHSWWKFDNILYRYNWAERVLDPFFKPPGKKRKDSGAWLFGQGHVVAEVSFAGAQYQTDLATSAPFPDTAAHQSFD